MLLSVLLGTAMATGTGSAPAARQPMKVAKVVATGCGSTRVVHAGGGERRHGRSMKRWHHQQQQKLPRRLGPLPHRMLRPCFQLQQWQGKQSAAFACCLCQFYHGGVVQASQQRYHHCPVCCKLQFSRKVLVSVFTLSPCRFESQGLSNYSPKELMHWILTTDSALASLYLSVICSAAPL